MEQFLLEKKYMRRAIMLAQKGIGKTRPNPIVGAVIVKNGEIIGEGFHRRYGMEHAEVNAIKDCTLHLNCEKLAGATLYVTLEPCCHFGKQPPCTDAIIKAKIAKVVVGSSDPNPLVSGKGCDILRQNGIEVVENFLKDECDALNQIFFHYITTKTPYVALKFAETIDGKIATKTGDAKWISGEKSRHFAHFLRKKYAGILVGIGTVLNDDPLLTCRLKDGVNPIRIVLDSNLRIPITSKIVQTAEKIPTIVMCSNCEQQKADELRRHNIDVVECDCYNLKKVMMTLGEKGIDSVLIEGGSKINTSALKSGIVNYVYAFVCPKIFGIGAKSAVEDFGVEKVNDCFEFKLKKVTKMADDVLLEYEKMENGEEN